MLLQTSLSHHKVPSISSTKTYSHPLVQNSQFTPPKTLNYIKAPTFTCLSSPISQVHNYGTMDYERRPIIKWNSLYRRIALMENPELGAGSVLNQWEKEGKKLTKWELCRVVKELRKFKKFKQALEVYNWMSSREERFRLSTSDAAIQLDLIAKVHGVASAENFFERLPESLKDKRIYGALLNAYVRARMKDKAEDMINRMREKGYALHSLPFNVIMTLYMNLKEYNKVDKMVAEMMEKNIQLDVYTYNIWLSSRGSQGSAEKMEEVFDQMKQDRTVNPNWTTFSTMATMYIKMGLNEKAEENLKKVEIRITGRDRIPYHYLISLYGNVGNKDEIYRVWNVYRSVFPSIPNLGYHAVISSLVRIGDIEGAEKIYEEWLSIKTSYDPRIGNLLMGSYIKDGNLDQAESFFEHMIEAGGKPNSSSWELLAEVYIGKRRLSKAFSCLKEAFTTEGSSNWKPKPVNVTSFLELSNEEGNTENKKVLEDLLRQAGHLEDHNYASLIGMSPVGNEESSNKAGIDEVNKDNNESEILPNNLQ